MRARWDKAAWIRAKVEGIPIDREQARRMHIGSKRDIKGIRTPFLATKHCYHHVRNSLCPTGRYLLRTRPSARFTQIDPGSNTGCDYALRRRELGDDKLNSQAEGDQGYIQSS